MTDATPRVLARLTASAPRRVIAVGILLLLAAMLIWTAAISPGAAGWKLLLFAIGLAAGWAALRLYRATGVGLVLTDEGIVQTDGRVVVTLDKIVDVDRGLFAWKPSNGFVVRLSQRHPVGWAPGMWWRYGRRLGVGGVTSVAGTKAMADILAMRLADPR